MLQLAITGGLCSGKSSVSQLLRARGCPVVDADAVGHALLNTSAQAPLLSQFGPGILDAAGAVSPARLAALVFAPGQEAVLAALNRILHPLIMAQAHAQLRQWAGEGIALAGVEAALLIEAKLLAGFDRVVVVVADAERRIQRFIERTGGSRQQALARMARQLPDEAKVRQADEVIENNGSRAALESQVEHLLARLRAEAAV